jgi:NADH pyrophosphatase NudC (nudix superfamily)
LVGVDQTNLNQQREISEIVWFDLESAKQNIRPYNIEKVQILTKLDRKIRSELHKYVPVPPVLTPSSSIVT